MFKTRFAPIIRRCVQSVYGRLYERSLESDLQELSKASSDLVDARKQIEILGQQLRCVSAISTIAKTKENRPKNKSAPEGWLHDEIFILGSGGSMLDLTPHELGRLGESTTLAMNKYLLYWNEIGIWPNYTFLADIHHPASEVLTRKVEMVAKSGKEVPRFILTSDYEAWPLNGLNPLFFKRPHFNGDFPWAIEKGQSMYYHRGSLTCLLNFITVHRLAPKVTLLGVDLDKGDSFFQETYDKDVSLHDSWEALRKETGVHPTALVVDSHQPIQERLPWVFERMAEMGVTVSVYNPGSLLAKQSLCPVRSRL